MCHCELTSTAATLTVRFHMHCQTHSQPGCENDADLKPLLQCAVKNAVADNCAPVAADAANGAGAGAGNGAAGAAPGGAANGPAPGGAGAGADASAEPTAAPSGAPPDAAGGATDLPTAGPTGVNQLYIDELTHRTVQHRVAFHCRGRYPCAGRCRESIP
jgi:hypothetical protein